MLELLNQSTKTFAVGLEYMPEVIYLASWDAVLYNDRVTIFDDFRKVFRDGTYFKMGCRVAFSGNFLSAENGRGAAWFSADGAVNVALLDEIVGLPLLGEPLNGADLKNKVVKGSFLDHVKGLVYTPGSRVSSGGVYYQEIKIYSLSTGALTNTLYVQFSSAPDWAPANSKLHYANASSLLLSADNRNVVVFDRVTGAVNFQGMIDANRRGVAYDSTHNVIIALLNSGQVAVYALNNVGYALSAPSLSPAPALYTLSKVTTRLTSADDQGVAGKAILWWLTNGKGALEKPYSLTDADGYAENWYYGPAGDFGLGSETVNVEVVV